MTKKELIQKIIDYKILKNTDHLKGWSLKDLNKLESKLFKESLEEKIENEEKINLSLFLKEKYHLGFTNPKGKKIIKGVRNLKIQNLIDLEDFEEIEKIYGVKFLNIENSSYENSITKYNFTWIILEDKNFQYDLQIDGTPNGFTEWAKNKYKNYNNF